MLAGIAGGSFYHQVDGDGDGTLQGAEFNDVLLGFGGNDLLLGDVGDDVLGGGTGDDSLEGGTGQDELIGADGADTLKGGEGADTLKGGIGADRMYGGAGDDVLDATDPDGGGATDALSGGDGNDTFILDVPVDGIRLSDMALITGGEGTDTLVLNTGGREEEVRHAVIAQLEASSIAYSVLQDGSIQLDLQPHQAAGDWPLGFSAHGIERIVFR
jgi:Ca2+-binding RTX toxin-like protein